MNLDLLYYTIKKCISQYVLNFAQSKNPFEEKLKNFKERKEFFYMKSP